MCKLRKNISVENKKTPQLIVFQGFAEPSNINVPRFHQFQPLQNLLSWIIVRIIWKMLYSHKILHIVGSTNWLTQNWLYDTEGCKDTPVESYQFRAIQAAFLGCIWRSLWNGTSDNLGPELGHSKNKGFHEFVSLWVSSKNSKIPQNLNYGLYGELYSPPQDALTAFFTGGFSLYLHGRESDTTTTLYSEKRNCK